MQLIRDQDYRKLTWRHDYALRKKGYKYKTLCRLRITTEFRPSEQLVSKDGWTVVNVNGVMVLQAGFCCDGPSGPTFDTPSTMRAAFFHNGCYQLIREGKLLLATHREMADAILYRLMIEDDAWPWRAKVWLWVVNHFAQKAAIA